MKKIAWMLILMMALSLVGCAKRNPGSAAGPETTTPADTAVKDDIVYITFYREGEGTTIPVTMVDGITGNYRIATNPEIFRKYSSENSDVFHYTLWENQPDVYYSVTYDSHTTAKAQANSLLEKHNGATSENVKIGGYDAIAVYASDSDAFMTQQHFYLIDHNGGCFLIETRFVMEMYEGLFPQMRALFDTFEIVD